LDGASAWRQFWSSTLPQLGPATVLSLILQILASLKLLDQAYQMLGGVASATTRSTVHYIYQAGFVYYRFGYSAALSHVRVALGPPRSLVQYIHEAGFVNYRFGFSAAISYVFFALIIIVGVAQALVLRRKKEL